MKGDKLMKLKVKLISLLLAVVMVLAIIPVMAIALPDDQAATVEAVLADGGEFKIINVEVINQRTAIVHLSNEISLHFEQMALVRANYLTNFIKVDDTYLQTNKGVAVGSGARIYIRDDRKSFELVLGSSTGTYSGQTFRNQGGTIQFDFENAKFVPYYHMDDKDLQEQSGDVWVRDIDDNPMTEGVVAYPAGTYGAAPNLAVSEARILDSRSI
jgi:hypothetical protein